MSEKVSVKVNHSLGTQAARLRIETGIDQFRKTLGSKLSVLEEKWIDNHLDFRVGMFGQTCQGTLDVFETYVRLEVTLPGMLGFFAKKVSTLARRKGQLLLEKQ